MVKLTHLTQLFTLKCAHYQRNFKLWALRKPMFEGLLPYLGRAVTARGFLWRQGHWSFWCPLTVPSLPLPLEVGALKQAPLNPARGSVSSPSGVWAKPQPPTILLHFEDLETLLMTSKMCTVLCIWFSFHAHSCLNRAHRIFVYFCIFRVEKNYRTPFQLPTLIEIA